jgi:hypothetical protein
MLIEWSDLVEYPGVLLVLSLTFVVYFFRGCCVGIYLGEYYRLVDILVHNPNCYLEIMRDALLFLVLPSAVGLAFTVVAFVRERRKSSNGLRGVSCLLLMVVGGFLFWWGVHGVRWDYKHYLYAIDDAAYWGVDLAEPLLKLYATAAAADILWLTVGLLWLVAGLLLMLSPAFKREKRAPTTN